MEEDDVVGEMDVLLGPTREAAHLLYVAQFPLRPAQSSLAATTDLKGRFRPNSQRMEIDVPLDVRSAAYDSHKGETLAAASSSTYEHEKMDFQTYASSVANGFLSNAYAVARVSEGALILEPVEGLLQFRHTLRYLNAAKGGPGGPKGDGGDSSQSDSETESRSVQVRFSREGEGSRRRRAKAAVAESEPWTQLRFPTVKQEPGEGDAALVAQLGQLDPALCVSRDHLALARTLIPRPKEELAEEARAEPGGPVSLAQLRALPLQAALAALLRNASVVPFDQLRSLLGVRQDAEPELLQLLAESACLVRGVWVLKSELVYPERDPNAGSRSRNTGPEPSIMRNTRDFVLYRLESEEWLPRKEISAAVRLKAEDLADVLKGVANFRVSKGYTFPYPRDNHFLDTYPDVAASEAAKWTGRWVELREWVRANAEAALAPPGRVKAASRRRTNSHRASTSAPAQPKTSPAAAKEAKHAAPPAAKDPKVAAPAAKEPAENGTPAAVELPAAVAKALEQFLYERFSERPVLGAEEAGRLLSLRLLESVSACELGSVPLPLPGPVFAAAAVKIGARAVATAEGRGLHVWGVGGNWGEVREFLAAWLTTKNRFRFKTFRDALNKAPAVSAAPSDDELKAILKDYCVFKSGTYNLIGTTNSS